MPTLLLRLTGPMQSWGTRSRFTERDTELEPSKSGVVGLICAALGRPRDEPVDDLARLRMGVRVDREGRMERDYQFSGVDGLARADQKPHQRANPKEGGLPSNRYYLADADFLVGLEGEATLLEAIEAALKSPAWQLFLGRKSFVPGLPVQLPGGGMREESLEDALRAWDANSESATAGSASRVRFVFEAEPGTTSELRMDQPIGAAFSSRTFGPRWVETHFHGGE